MQSLRVGTRCLRHQLNRNARVAFSTGTNVGRQPATEAELPTYNGPTGLFIDNAFVPSSTAGSVFTPVSPVNGKPIVEIAEATADDVDAAVQAAHRAFTQGPWNSMTGRERGVCLTRLADLIQQNVPSLAEIESLNNGKPLSQSLAVDAPACAGILRYYAGWADKLNGLQIPVGEGFLNYTRHEPVGVCGLVVPWNLPLIAVAAKLGPALCAGNTVVLKSAEQTPLTALMLADLAKQAGFPDGVINIISGPGVTTGNALISHPLVDKVSFTGSVPTGQRIQEVAAQTVKRVTLELGGNNPMIVFADCDIDKTVEIAHGAQFWNDGEACASGSRIFVQDSIYDEFVEKSVALARKRVVGNPFSADSMQGAQVSEQQLSKVMGYIESAKSDGAELLCGGQRVGDQGCYLEPTVFSQVHDDMKVFKEEVFGPVMAINRFSGDVDEVITRANDSPFGLACGVFTQDIRKGNAVANRVRAGMLFWNCYHCMDIAAPFGGMKQSGMGREGGPYGVLPYMEVKNVIQSIV